MCTKISLLLLHNTCENETDLGTYQMSFFHLQITFSLEKWLIDMI